MHFLKEQADKDAVKIVIMCAKNRRWSRLECANGSKFYSDSDLCKCRKAALKCQQIWRMFTWHKMSLLSELSCFKNQLVPALSEAAFQLLQNEIWMANPTHFPVWCHSLGHYHKCDTFQNVRLALRQVHEKTCHKESDRLDADSQEQCDSTGTCLMVTCARETHRGTQWKDTGLKQTLGY